MRTVRCSGRLMEVGRWEWGVYLGACLPGGVCLGCLCVYTSPPPVDRVLDTRSWKYYLSATTVADGNNVTSDCCTDFWPCVTFLPPTKVVREGYVIKGVCLLIGVGISVQRGSLSRRRVSIRGVSIQGGYLSKGGICPGGFSVQEGSLSGRPPPHMVTCGQYASYWNAFLLYLKVMVSFSSANLSIREKIIEV